MRTGEPEPLVAGGHQEAIPRFLAILPADLGDRLAGSFIVDPHTMTPARMRELSGTVIEDWVNRREQRLLAQLRQQPPDGRMVTGLRGCLTAVGQHAVQLLVVPVGGLIPGFACTRCGVLTSTPGECVDGLAAARQARILSRKWSSRLSATAGKWPRCPIPRGYRGASPFPTDPGPGGNFA